MCAANCLQSWEEITKYSEHFPLAQINLGSCGLHAWKARLFSFNIKGWLQIYICQRQQAAIVSVEKDRSYFNLLAFKSIYSYQPVISVRPNEGGKQNVELGN